MSLTEYLKIYFHELAKCAIYAEFSSMYQGLLSNKALYLKCFKLLGKFLIFNCVRILLN